MGGGGRKGLCLLVATNTSVLRICERKQAVPVSCWGRSGTGERQEGTRGKVAAHLRQLCRESGRPRLDTGRPPPPRTTSGHRGASGPVVQMPLSPERRAPGGLQREQPRGGQPRAGGQGTAACVSAALGGRCAGGYPAPDAPSPSRGTSDYSNDAEKPRAEPGMLARQSGKPAQQPQDHVP